MAEERSHASETLIIKSFPDEAPPDDAQPRTAPVVPSRPTYEITTAAPLVVSSFLPGDKPRESLFFPVMGVECAHELSYWHGLASAWSTDRVIVNVEQDMEFSDELIAELVDCEHPLCAYPYQVYPTMLGRYIYCATTTQPDLNGHPRDPRWLEGPDDQWAVWSSIGFCKIAPEARVKPLDAMFWQWLEHCVNRVVCQIAGLQWHIHWPEIRHAHDYEKIADHLW